VRLRQMRLGELSALAGAALVLLCTFEPSYHGPLGSPDAWHSFGAAVALMLAAVCAALAMVSAALTERTAALPVSTAVWCFALGVAGSIAAIVRVLERPDHATSVGVGGWLGLAGSLVILAGAFEVLRDERTSLYEPARPEPRARPGG